MVGAAEIEEGVALCLLVALEHDRLAAAVPVLAGKQGMLAAFAVACEVGVRTVRLRDGGIVFLDAPAHLGDEAFLEVFCVAERCRRIGVLLRKMASDFG